jgi:organic hydroperoxide reductase OsmC/OhrA
MSDMTTTHSGNRLPPPAVEPDSGFSLSIRLYSGFEQIVDFKLPGVAVLGLDERPPKGNGWGPSPSRLLGAALGACLGASLLAWLRARGTDVRDMHTHVTGSFGRDSAGRRTIDRLDVRLVPIVESPHAVALPTVTELFDASVVARSIDSGIDVRLTITPEAPAQLRRSANVGSYSPMARSDVGSPYRAERAG